MKTIQNLKPGDLAQVVKVHGEGPIRQRIMDMGIIRGCKVEMVKKAPLGDPIAIKLKGYDLSLRASEASLIEVQ